MLNRDFKNLESPDKGSGRRVPVSLWYLMTGVAAGLALFYSSMDATAERHDTSGTEGADALSTRVSLSLPRTHATTINHSDPMAISPSQWHEITVADGDTLHGIFQRLGLDTRQLYAVLDANEMVKRLLNALRPGQTLAFAIKDKRLQTLRLNHSATKSLVIRQGEKGFTTELQTKQIEHRPAYDAGVIGESFFVAGERAGLSDKVIMELAQIFAWDIDFALDIRRGDRFGVIYEELYVDGEKLEDGDILAAEFVNRGKSYRAVRYIAPNGKVGYYTPDGYSTQKAFLRSPVDFHRISSTFQAQRWHPVLGIKRPHRGVDYAAAIGTPVKASGDGRIIFRGTKGGYGKTVIVQHGGRYTTLYAHLSRFRRGQIVGSRVRQGQVIGYVGMTGLSTGPHLHYEFRVNDVHRDPLKVKLPSATPVAKLYRSDFFAQSKPLLAQLDLYEAARLAQK